jgi:cysteine-rich repeat protein
MWQRSWSLSSYCALGFVLLTLSPSLAMAVCGDNIIDLGEQCDDGNTTNRDCCSSSCQYEATGAPCTDEGAICTTDRCDGGGTCLHTAGPDPMCSGPVLPRKGLVLFEPDRLSVRLRHIAEILNGFGDPRASETYGLCVYDSSLNSQPLLVATVPAGALCSGGRECWRLKVDRSTGSYAFNDPTGTYDGINKIRLDHGRSRPAQANTQSIKIRGESPTLAYPAPPFTPPVTVQVRASNGSCWGAVYSTPRVNDAQQFRAAQD